MIIATIALPFEAVSKKRLRNCRKKTYALEGCSGKTCHTRCIILADADWLLKRKQEALDGDPQAAIDVECHYRYE